MTMWRNRINMYLLRNPTLEDQALARIHRIGQTKEVTTVRFIVRDSFEEVRSELTSYFQYILQIPTRVLADLYI